MTIGYLRRFVVVVAALAAAMLAPSAPAWAGPLTDPFGLFRNEIQLGGGTKVTFHLTARQFSSYCQVRVWPDGSGTRPKDATWTLLAKKGLDVFWDEDLSVVRPTLPLNSNINFETLCPSARPDVGDETSLQTIFVPND